jgi:1-acyl-sn-glycerol-3-phosphate acyltransferase
MRVIIASLKLFFFGLLCLLIIPLQILWLLAFKNSPLYFVIPTLFNRLTLFIFRIKVEIEGTPSTNQHVIYVGNHLSYIDISVLGGNLPATFISKADVRQWPVFGTLASISQTVYIERHRGAAIQCIQDIKKSLSARRSLILFPEGTSTQGFEVLPFKSSIFELFLNDKLKESLIAQPFTISIQKIGTHTPPSLLDHDIYAWYGDMELPPHLWMLALSKGATIRVEFHSPRPAKAYDNRKIFAQDCQKDVDEGLARALTR